MPDTVQTAIYRLSYQLGDGIQQLNAAQRATDGVVQSAERLAVAEEKVNRASRISSDEVSRTVARLDKRVAAEQQLQRELARVARWQEEGIGTSKQQAQVIDLATARYQRQVQALDTLGTHMDKATTSGGLMRHEMINLSRQVQDIGVSLSGGQSPFRVLVEQGTQVADIFASSRATMGGFFGQIVSGVGSVLTPMRLLVGGMLGFATAAGTAASSWISAQKDVEMALAGIGRASGVTAGQIQEIAESSASLFALSTSEAREFATALAATGRIGRDQIASITSLGKDLSRILGVDLAEAGKIAAKAFSDPGKGVDVMNAAIGSIDAGTRRYIINLTEQNRLMEAQRTLAEATARGLDGIKDKVGGVTNAWTGLGNAISEAWEWSGKFIARALNITPRNFEAEIAQLQARAAELRSGAPVSARRGGTEGQESLRRVEEQLQKINKEWTEYQQHLENVKRAQESMAQEKIVRDLVPEIAQLQELENRLIATGDLLRKIKETGGKDSPILAALKLSLEDVVLAAERAKGHFESALTPAQKLTAEFELQMQSITARTAAERVALASRQEALKLAGQNLSQNERSLEISRAGALEAARLTQAHKDSTVALRDQLAIVQARTGEDRQAAQQRADYNRLIREGRTEEEAMTEAVLQRKIAQENANRAVEEQTRSIRQQMELVEARLNGEEETVKAAQAYANAIRSGADATRAAALAATVLAQEMQKAEQSANDFYANIEKANIAAGKGGAFGGSFMGDLTSSGPLGPNDVYKQRSSTGIYPGVGTILPAAGTTGGVWYKGQVMTYQEASRQQQADIAAYQSQRASQTQVSGSSTSGRRSATAVDYDKIFQELVAGQLVAGIDPRSINAQIEAGTLRSSPNATFEAQLDLYKRAGMTPQQILQDIRAGIIGEGADATALLRAIDELTKAVNSNTDAQIGLSSFYTQQGDRLLGYRGYSVSGGASGGLAGGTAGTIGGAPMGGVVNAVTGGYTVGTSTGGMTTTGTAPAVGTWLPSTLTYTPSMSVPTYTAGGWSSGAAPRHFADGGIAYGPSIFGEAGPEAAVPLVNGSIPVKLSSNLGSNAPTALRTIISMFLQSLEKQRTESKPDININAPLVHFAAEPNRDEVRESSFQAGQALRRIVSQAAA